jgi:hypothetical protein
LTTQKGSTVSQTLTASESLRSARRSTRIDKAIPLTIIGVDSARGPYREDVATATISGHGCRYESKYDVLHGSVVMLELNSHKNGSPASTARGRVKWARRPGVPGGMYETAIELDEPGNFWGVEAPPQDWLNAVKTQIHQTEAPKTKPFAIARPEPASTANLAAREKHPLPVAPFVRDAETKYMPGTAARPISELMKNFQQQMESMLSEAASSAVQDKVATTLDDARGMLRDEAHRVVADAAASAAVPWIEQSLLQIQQASQKSAMALHAQWRARMEEEIQAAVTRIDARHHDFESRTEILANAAIEKLNFTLDASRREGIDRIVASLKQQFTPLVEQARTVAAELQRMKHETESLLNSTVESFTARTEEAGTRLEQRFSDAVEERLAAARSELEHISDSAMRTAIENLRNATHHHEAEAHRRLQEEVHPITDAALHSLREAADDTSRKFVGELKDHSRSQLESMSKALAELAKSLGQDSKE